MALVAAAITSVTTRAVEWGTGYDQLINDYVSAKDEGEKIVRWRAIMDNIRLYPRWHGSLLVTKGIADGFLLWSAATTVPKYLKDVGPKVIKSLKNCWSKFVEFLRKMCNTVYDIYNSSKNGYAKMRQNLCQQLSKLWETFYSNLCDTLANVAQKCEKLWKWLQEKGVSIQKDPETGKAQIIIDNAMYTAVAGIGKVAYDELKSESGKNNEFEEKSGEYIIVTAMKGAAAAVTSGVVMVGSFAFATIYELLFGLMGWIVPLIYWIGGQIKTELYKYVCSIYGLIECYFGQIPQKVLEEEMLN